MPEAVGLEDVLATGQELQHVEQLAYAAGGHPPDPARIPELIECVRRAGVAVTPTLAAQEILCTAGTPLYAVRLERAELAYVDVGLRGWWESLRGNRAAGDAVPPFLAFQRELVHALAAAGVPLLVGTDTPNPLLVAGFSVHEELAALEAAGLSRAEVLRAATSTPARVLGLDSGRVAPGLRADLVLLAADPLESLAALRAPLGVMAHGRWLGREELEALLDAAELAAEGR